MAALTVVLAHIGFAWFTARLHIMSNAGAQAVDVFFVLSGFVIAHVYATREQNWFDYTVSRAARIYSVVLPGLLLMALVDGVGRYINPAPYNFFRGDMWHPSILLPAPFFTLERWDENSFPGSNGAYWSIGFEVWYYVMFGLFVFLPGLWRWLAVVAVAAFIGPKVSILFPLWLMGVGAYYVCRAKYFTQNAGWVLLIVPPLGFAGWEASDLYSPIRQYDYFSFTAVRLASTLQDYFIGAMFALHLIGFATVSDRFAPFLEKHARAIRWVAGATFSLYLIHMPLLHFMVAVSPWPIESLMNFWWVLIATLVCCFAFAQVTERRKDFWHRLFTRLLRRVRP